MDRILNLIIKSLVIFILSVIAFLLVYLLFSPLWL